MQLVMRVDRADPPTRTAACEAAAAAVVTLLADPRVAEGGPLASLVARWLDGRIRKVVRRARGAKWDATAAVPHVEVARPGAQLRAFVPGPTDSVPPPLAKLQVAGSELELGESRWPNSAAVRIAVTPHVVMSTGKMPAQCGHAAQLAWMAMNPTQRAAWAAAGFPVQIEYPDAEAWEQLVATAALSVTDAGFTEIPPGTNTTVATWTMGKAPSDGTLRCPATTDNGVPRYKAIPVG